MKYPKLFSPGNIGNLTIKNRIVMEPLSMGVAERDQSIGDDFLAYLLERARGGVGLIILENTRVDDAHGVAAERQASMARDEHIAPLRRAADVLHAEGVALFTQLHHPGRETFSNLNGNAPVWSSGSRPCGVCQQQTHEMTTAEVEQVIQLFIDGAVRTQQSGCDGVELHGAHGYLISQFLSPYTNQRNDRFGGSFEGRFEFLKEIVQGIQKACGTEFPISVRLTVDELLGPNGVKEYLTLDDGLKVCQALEALGVAVLDISNGIYESFNALSEPMTYPQGCRTERIRRIREGTHIPLIAVNMVKEPWFAEKMLEEDLVDFVGLGRAVLADPAWALKAREGREDEINRCISCTFCFETLVSDTIAGKGPVKCAVNPRAGRERLYPDYRQDGAGRLVAVVGGGVAGLEAARVLAERGFKPVVLEKSDRVGGQINVADKPPHKEKIDWIVDYELKQLALKGVEIRTNTEATVEMLEGMKPYAVILATGAVPLRPGAIPGVELPSVHTVDEVLSGAVELRDRRVVLVGSGVTGLETAEFLCAQGNQVVLVEMLDAIGKGVYVQHYLDAMDRLKGCDITFLPSHRLVEIDPNGVVLDDLLKGKRVNLPADDVVLALGVRSVADLVAPCEQRFEKIRVVGDAEAPGRIESAVRSGFEAAYSL